MAMTMREFFNAVINFEGMSDEMVKKAQAEIEKMDNANKAKSSKQSANQKQNEEIKAKILEILTEGGMLASEVGATLEISTNKAVALCNQLVTDGSLKVEDKKIAKVGKRKFYSLA